MTPKRKRVVTSAHSKNACKTCRIRKVKCDEAKPACNRCTSTGRTCDGYPIPKSPNNGSQSTTRPLLPSSQQQSSPSSSLTPPSTISSYPLSPSPAPSTLTFQTTPSDLSSFSFFLSTTQSAIHQSSPNKAWLPLALQLSHSEPALFHAIAAVGRIDIVQEHACTHTLTRQAPAVHQTAALRLYCKATALLRQYITDATTQKGKVPLEPVLLCCLMFACYEVYQDRGAWALGHLQFGRRILADVNRTVALPSSPNSAATFLAPQSPSLTDELLATFTSLEASSIAFDRRRALLSPLEGDAPVWLSCLRGSFSSESQAKEALEALLAAMTGWQRRVLQSAEALMRAKGIALEKRSVHYCVAHCISRFLPLSAALDHERQELLKHHHAWLQSFSKFIENQATDRTPNRLLLQIQLLFSLLMLHDSHSSALLPSPSSPVQSNPLLESIPSNIIPSILASAEQYTTLATPQPAQSAEAPIRLGFSVEVGLLPPLWFVSLKAPIREQRVKALNLLAALKRQEGIFWSPVMADFGQGILGFEGEKLGWGIEEIGEGKERKGVGDVDVVVMEPNREVSTEVVFGRVRRDGEGTGKGRTAVELVVAEGPNTPPFALHETERLRFPLD